MKIKTEKIVYILWTIILLLRLSIDMEKYFIPKSITLYYIVSVITGAFLVQCISRMRSRKINSLYIICSEGLIIYAVLFGFIFTNDLLMDKISFNFKEMIIFYALIVLMGLYVYYKQGISKFLKVSYYVLAYFMIIMLINNINGLSSVSTLLNNVMLGYERNRVAFGFGHPNIAGNAILCCLILSIYVYEYTKKTSSNWKLKCSWIVVIDLALCYMLLSTASRSSISGAVLLMIIKVYYRLISILKNRSLKFFSTFILVVIVLGLLLFSGSGSLKSLVELSNRLYNFTYNLPILQENNRLLFGLGFIGSGEFMNLSIYNTFFVDNYFLYVLMSTGIVGTVFISAVVIYMAYKIFSNTYQDNKFGELVKTIFLINLFTSLFETCFMYPSFISCFVYSVLYMVAVCQPRKCDYKIQ